MYGHVFNITSFLFLECQDQSLQKPCRWGVLHQDLSKPFDLGRSGSSTARALPAPQGGIFLWKLRLQRALAPHYHGVNYDKWPCSNFPGFSRKTGHFLHDFYYHICAGFSETFQLSWAPFSPFLSDRHLDTHLNRWGVRDAIFEKVTILSTLSIEIRGDFMGFTTYI